MAYDLTEGTWVQKAQKEEQRYLVFSLKYLKEAKEFGIKFGTSDFIIYQYMRWCEDEGEYGFMFAGLTHIKEMFGFDSESNVRDSLNHLRKLGAVAHVDWGERILRNKTKVWVSRKGCETNQKLQRLLAVFVDASTNLPNSFVDTSTNFVDTSTNFVDTSTNRTPVKTGAGNNKLNKNIKYSEPLMINNENDAVDEESASTGLRPVSGTPPTALVEVRQPEPSSSSSSSKESFFLDAKPSPKDEAKDEQGENRGGLVSTTEYGSRLCSTGVATGVKHNPFDEAVDGPVTVKKPGRRAREGAIANKLVAVGGFDKRQARDSALVNNIHSLLEAGYTEEELEYTVIWAKDDEFYRDQPLRTMLSKDAVMKAVEAKKKKDEVARRRDNPNPEFDVVW